MTVTYIQNVNPPVDVQPIKEEPTRALGNQTYSNAPPSDNPNTGKMPVFNLSPPPLPAIFTSGQLANMTNALIPFSPTDLTKPIGTLEAVSKDLEKNITSMLATLPKPGAILTQAEQAIKGQIDSLLTLLK